MSKRPDAILIEDMAQAAQRVVAYCHELSYDNFIIDLKTQDAVVRNIEILGEAAGNVSADFKAAHPVIPWGNITGMRNRLIHGYFGVNWDIVWTVVQDDMPGLVAILETISG